MNGLCTPSTTSAAASCYRPKELLCRPRHLPERVCGATLGATWLFDNGEDVVIALVLGWNDVHWFVQDSEGAWKVPRAAWLPRARLARAA